MWLAICLSLTALLLAVMNLRERAKKKAELNKKISELKLQALRAQMNPHFVFNTINSIQYFISSNERKAAYRYLSKFSKLMRRVLDNAEKSKLPISEELDSLKLYLELESLRFEGKFNYKIVVDAKIDVHNIEIPTLLIQPFVENAIHHGLRFKRSNGTLDVQISLGDNTIICIIEDNGIGIQKALKSKNKNGGHKPVGLKVSQERLATLNELRKNGRGVEIIDLAKTNGGTGTRVKIVIPIEDA
jgi:LytS/YehU family sensor histidine kinase